MNSSLYPSDLTDNEWSILHPLLARQGKVGRRLTYDLRDIVGAVFYLLRTGAQWRLLPYEYPPWRAVYHPFAKWRREGTWGRVNQALRERYRLALGRSPQPSAAIIDSQSAKDVGRHGLSRAKGLAAQDARLDTDHQPALVDWGQWLLGRARSDAARDPEGLPWSAAQMGCGTNIRLALPQSPPEQRL